MDRYFYNRKEEILYELELPNVSQTNGKKKGYYCVIKIAIYYKDNPTKYGTNQKSKDTQAIIKDTYFDTKEDSTNYIYQKALMRMGNVKPISKSEFDYIKAIYQ